MVCSSRRDGKSHYAVTVRIRSVENVHGCVIQASKLGLLSKLERAGLSLRDVEKLLPLSK